MSEHKNCIDCQYNNYPLCQGTKMEDENYMNIEKLKRGFICGQKDHEKLTDFSIKYKSDLELKVEALEAKILKLEEKEVLM